VPVAAASEEAGIAWYREWHWRFLRRALRTELAQASNVVVYAQCPLAARAALDVRRGPHQRVVMAVHFDGSQADEWVDKGLIRDGGRVYRRIRALERLTIPNVDGVVFMSASATQSLRRYGLCLDASACQLVPNFAAPSTPRIPPTGGADLVTVGGLELYKNHQYLLHVLAAAKDLGRRYTVDIIGDGPTRRPLARLARELGIEDQVHLLGYVSGARDFLPAYRAYAHTATREVLPYAVIEAMAAGLPVVAGRIGGIAEMISDGSEGYFWPLDDAPAAAEVLVRLLDDEPHRAELGAQARVRFEDRYDARVVGPLLVDFLVHGRRGELPLVAAAPDTATRGDRNPPPPLPPEPKIVEPDDAAGRAKPSRRVFITTVDQAFSSASNFAVGVVVAHIAGLAGLGAFAVAYTAWLALGTAHRALITDPMAIDNDVLRADASARMSAGLAAEVTLGLGAAALLALLAAPLLFTGLRSYAIALLVLALFLPVLLVQDYWRWVGFMQARPERSLANDTLFNCVQALGFVVLIGAGFRSPSIAIVAWGVGAAAGAVYGARQFSVRFTRHGGPAMIRSRWPMSKWLFAGGLASWGSAQAYPLLAGPGVGSVGLGGLKAAQNLMSGPTLVLIQAGGSIGLPEASRSLERGGWPRLRRVALFVTLAGVASVGLVAAVVFAQGARILRVVYGGSSAHYATAARIIAFAWLVQTLGLGPILVLKATKQARMLFNIAVTSVVAACLLIPACSFAWGVNGTAWALVATAAVTAVVEIAAYYRTSRAFALDPHAKFEDDVERAVVS
jgi:glycosyltransferase involved in cell wall biosynthesis/O-antigen/teichoic acid export membrane protein